ncbi:hypothetical protein PY254_16325 [Rhodanobacter sp. AS-Z3]|uniref:hypothetical protein n=1 Tax=Rhodanobacter sp. AS-Z3 TaxID=3031330 RepID=UPI00247AC62C|nr:hypothetical protein [Rhodanobacter sp. AS-Z3]WEN14779.1 hypothetical protein PY254_16325 [Rhodanobacter sp. AS-Z3]
MKNSEFLERQNSTLKEVEKLTNQLSSGEIGQEEGMARIESTIQTLEAKTRIQQQRSFLRQEMPRVLWHFVIFLILFFTLIAAHYFGWIA